MNKSILALIFSMFLAAPMFAADLGGRVISIGSDTTYPPHEFIEDGVVKDTGDGDDPIQVLLDEARDEKERALIRMRLGID